MVPRQYEQTELGLHLRRLEHISASQLTGQDIRL